MSDKNKILFLTKTSKYTYDKKIDIILSPELYWVRIFDIPIKSKKDTLAVVPSFFEDFLDIKSYKFYVIKKEDDKNLCFAYDEKFILKTIRNANINLNQVCNIFFAQNEFENLNSFKIEDDYFTNQDDILIKLPKEFINLNEIVDFNLDTIKLSKHSISINKTNKYIDNKSIYILSFIFLITSFLNFGKSIVNNNNIDKIIKNQTKITKQYKMLPTMMQTKSVIKTLERKQAQQIKLRDALKKTFNVKNKKIKKVSFKNNKVIYE